MNFNHMKYIILKIFANIIYYDVNYYHKLIVYKMNFIIEVLRYHKFVKSLNLCCQ